MRKVGGRLMEVEETEKVGDDGDEQSRLRSSN
jgi:hypothetical protein